MSTELSKGEQDAIMAACTKEVAAKAELKRADARGAEQVDKDAIKGELGVAQRERDLAIHNAVARQLADE